jgi:hypothetical protein
MNSTETLPALPMSPEAPTQRRRRREELELLAAEFVNSRIHVRQPPRRQLPKAAMAAAGGVLVVAALAWLLWPTGAAEPQRDAAPAVNENEAWARRLEAERERQRLQLQQSRDYLAKMAAADSALLGEMTARAQGLAARADVAPTAPTAAAHSFASRPQSGEPTPKTGGPAPVAVTVTATPAPAKAQAEEPAPTRTESARTEPARSEPARAQPVASPTGVAAASCGIHVSELSASGKLTYADVARMKGARTESTTGHVFTPPVDAGRGRNVVFEVMPNGCVRIARQLSR